MQRAYGVAIGLALSACYSPTVLGGAPCDPARNDSCPTGQSCIATGGGGVCMADHMRSGPDAGSDGAMPPIDGGTCLGGHLLGSLCLQKAPTAPLTLSATTLVNTATVGTGGCTEIHPQTGGPSLCILSGTTIDVPSGATLRAIALNPVGSTATATNPLVLVATGSITITGTIDVSSHFAETAGGVPVLGAGARTVTGCLVTGVDGQTGSGNNGGGGAAGGSFGGSGAAGGNGGNSNNTAHGTPAAASSPTALVGGCPGGHGGDGAGGGAPSGGVGGSAGGAIYLLAGDSITIAGKINASGSAGDGGGPGNQSSGGGGGGGAGGMIGLEAGRIMVTGAMFANGAGGGGGGGNDGVGDAGNRGNDPSAPLTPAAGGSATNGGGSGGAGSAGTTAPVAGKNGSGSFPQCGGGGGGGGAGVIRAYGPASSLTGQISPTAS